MATVTVEFKTPVETYTLVFGDSYKTWKMQLQEYLWRLRDRGTAYSIESLYKSNSRYVQNGLKWCSLEEYQDELDQEFKEDKGRKIHRRLSEFNWVKIDAPKGLEL